MARTVLLRPWQRRALDRFVEADAPDFLAVATPGAGKTTFALTCARWWLARHPGARLVVVAPTAHLKRQWSAAAADAGLHLDPDWSPADAVLPADVHGVVTTYQQVSSSAPAVRRVGAGAFVVLDEVHHAGDDRAWGTALLEAFAGAGRRLALSGTPFRSDQQAIPFVRYLADEAVPDVEYGYADALRDGGVVRPVYFPRIDGLMEWSAPDGSVNVASFQDALDRRRVAERLRTALSLEGDWLATVLGEAHRRLAALRAEEPDAAGLVIAMDQDHARGIARLLRERVGTAAEVVTSDDPTASHRIARFARSSLPWLVAVRMVSEGVDIPRLRVGVYATTTATELFFRQAVGRVVRWRPGARSQKAYVYLPDDPRLRTHAFAVQEARRHSLRRPKRDEETTTDEAALDRRAVELDAEQLSLFSVISAVATEVSVHAVTAAGVAFDDEPDPPAPPPADDGLVVALDPLPVPGGSPWLPPATDADGRPLPPAEHRRRLREANAELAAALVLRTGTTHAQVNAELNRLAGISRVAEATAAELARRLEAGERWLRRTALARGERA